MFSPDEARGQVGLRCEYFAGRGFEAAPIVARAERGIGKLVSHSAMRPGEPAAYGALRWSGWFWPRKDGRHEFSMRGPGQMRMWLDGAALIDDATPGELDSLDVGGGRVPRKTVAVDLGAGRGVEVRIEYVRADPIRSAETDANDGSQGLNWEYVGVGLREPRGSVQEAADLAAGCDAAIVVIGSGSTTEGEGYDRPDIELPGDQNALVEAVLAANPRTVVVLTNGAPYALPWIDHAPAVLEGWLGGEAGADAVARIIFGESEPSGRLPVTFPVRLEDTPAHAFYPGTETVTYGERLNVGYRHFDRSNEPPLFAFGHGLTYTRFVYSEIEAPESAAVGEPVTVTFRLKNVGQRHGKETAQLYVRPRGPSQERPVKELKAFAKVALAPSEATTVRLVLDARAFAFYDPGTGEWLVEPGAYDLLVGGSAADIELQATVRLLGRE
jgi:beta-glucosidase